MTADKPLLGISFMMVFCVLAPLGDAMAKLLSSMPLMQIVGTRFALQVLILVPVVIYTRQNLRMSRRGFALTALRTLFHIIGIGAMFLSLRFLPLADAVAIAFVMPFIMLLLGRFFLNEEVGPRRLIACAIGFGGTMMVVQPSFSEVGMPALLPMVVAVVFACFMLVTRMIAKEIDAIALQTVSGGMACLVLLPLLFVFDGTGVVGWDPAQPSRYEWSLLFGMGVVGTIAHLCMTWSLRFAPSATLAPMQYLEIPFATLIGWLVFADFPDGLALIGIAVVLASGLYIVWREQVTARDARRSLGPAPPAV